MPKSSPSLDTNASSFRGLKKCSDDDDRLRGTLIEDTEENEACEAGDAALVAGTSWLFSREGMDSSLDYLFIDEAGQVSLADAVAMGTSARNIVLLGDPQQLPQVRQGHSSRRVRPLRARASAGGPSHRA